MQKIRKILRAVSEKTALPPDQLLQHQVLKDLAEAAKWLYEKIFNIGLKYIILSLTEGNPLDSIMTSKFNFNIKICKISKSSKIYDYDFHY